MNLSSEALRLTDTFHKAWQASLLPERRRGLETTGSNMIPLPYIRQFRVFHFPHLALEYQDSSVLDRC